jgi:hypothetical protein
VGAIDDEAAPERPRAPFAFAAAPLQSQGVNAPFPHLCLCSRPEMFPALARRADDNLLENRLSDVAKAGVDKAEVAKGGLTVGVGRAGDLLWFSEAYDLLDEFGREFKEHRGGGGEGGEGGRGGSGELAEVNESASRVEWKKEREGRRDVGSYFSSSTRSGGQGEG